MAVGDDGGHSDAFVRTEEVVGGALGAGVQVRVLGAVLDAVGVRAADVLISIQVLAFRAELALVLVFVVNIAVINWSVCLAKSGCIVHEMRRVASDTLVGDFASNTTAGRRKVHTLLGALVQVFVVFALGALVGPFGGSLAIRRVLADETFIIRGQVSPSVASETGVGIRVLGQAVQIRRVHGTQTGALEEVGVFALGAGGVVLVLLAVVDGPRGALGRRSEHVARLALRTFSGGGVHGAVAHGVGDRRTLLLAFEEVVGGASLAGVLVRVILAAGRDCGHGLALVEVVGVHPVEGVALEALVHLRVHGFAVLGGAHFAVSSDHVQHIVHLALLTIIGVIQEGFAVGIGAGVHTFIITVEDLVGRASEAFVGSQIKSGAVEIIRVLHARVGAGPVVGVFASQTNMGGGEGHTLGDQSGGTGAGVFEEISFEAFGAHARGRVHLAIIHGLRVVQLHTAAFRLDISGRTGFTRIGISRIYSTIGNQSTFDTNSPRFVEPRETPKTLVCRQNMRFAGSSPSHQTSI